MKFTLRSNISSTRKGGDLVEKPTKRCVKWGKNEQKVSDFFVLLPDKLEFVVLLLLFLVPFNSYTGSNCINNYTENNSNRNIGKPTDTEQNCKSVQSKDATD